MDTATKTAVITPTAPSRAMRAQAGVLVLLLPALALTTSFGMTLVQLLILLMLGWRARGEVLPTLRRHWPMLGPYLVGCMAYFVIGLGRLVLGHLHLSSLDGPFRILLSLSCIAFVAVLRPPVRMWWIGLCIGAIGAGVVAMLETAFYVYTDGFWFGINRAEGFTHHPITFGNLALALGMLSTCAIGVFRGSRLSALPWFGLLFGLIGSLLSVSRGGWPALLVCAIPLLAYRTAVNGRAIVAALVATAVLCVAAYLVPATGVATRVEDAVSDVHNYVQNGDASTNVGIRFDLWKASWLMFIDHPLVGVGREQFYPHLRELADEHRLGLYPNPVFNSSSHNDVLHFMSTGGLLDLSTYLLMLGAPAVVYLRILRRRGDARQPLALAGLLMVLCIFTFGMTDSMFWLMTPKVMYAMFTGVLLGFCARAETQ
jgi:O-antigen ligase